MSKVITTYTCNECPQPKGDASNWFSVRCKSRLSANFMPFDHAHDLFLDEDLLDFCGNSCAQKYLERWLGGNQERRDV